MTHSRGPILTTTSFHAPSRGVAKNKMTQTIRFPKPATPLRESIDQCYRALLETSSSAVLLLSPESIILGWNRAAEALSGWIADEALGHSYAELCLPMQTREPFLRELAQVTAGSEVRGFESSIRTRTGSQTMLCWNISRVLGARGNLIGLMAIGHAVAPHTEIEERLQLAPIRLREEARRTQMAIEEERRRIARELHDEFVQALTGLKFDLAWFGMKLMQSPAPPLL